MSPPWKPTAKPVRFHRGLEAFGFHTSRNPDGGFTYKPLTRGVGPFYSIGVGSFYVVKAKPVLVVESTEVLESLHPFRDRLEVPDPEQLLLERFEEAFDTAVAFGLANERRRRFHAQETDFVLEIVAHELRAVIVPESKSSGGVGLEASEVFMDALPEWSRASKRVARLTA